MYAPPIAPEQPSAQSPAQPSGTPAQPQEDEEETDQDQARIRGSQGNSKSFRVKGFEEARGIIDSYHKDILAALRRSGGPQDEEILDKTDMAMTVVALLALDEMGDDIDTGNVPSEIQEVIDRELSLTSAALAAIIVRALNGTDMEPTADRMSSHLWRVYWDVWAQAEVDDGQEYAWELGATEQHCEDCLTYSELGARPRSFWKEIASTRGHYPRSSALACSGVYCDCSLT